ncbi:MAG: glycosyl transferase family 2, partial [Alphaproteobacteria bacterium]
EKLLIPAFVFFFQMLYPFPAINRGTSDVAGAAGGCILVRRDRLAAAGGLAAIKSALIDDCALARLVKDHGGRLWLGLADDSFSIRAYPRLGDIWAMVARTADTQLGHSLPLLAATLGGLAIVYGAPPLLLLAVPWHGDFLAAGLAASACAAMAAAYGPTLGYYRQSRWWSALLPVAAMLYGAMTVSSAIRHRRGRGGAWKERHYA